MVMVGYDHQDEEAVIYVAYFEIICAMGIVRRDKGSALFHIIVCLFYFRMVICCRTAISRHQKEQKRRAIRGLLAIATLKMRLNTWA